MLTFVVKGKNQRMHLGNAFIVLACLTFFSCTKEEVDPFFITTTGPGASPNPTQFTSALSPSPVTYTPPVLSSESNRILVDASRDGGVWWYPQYDATGYSATAPHQGKALADHLRSLGYEVDELPRGTEITEKLLSQYDKVIRANAFGQYTPSELAAYAAFLDRPTALLLLQDHHKNTTNDNLSKYLNLPFTGAETGTITRFAPHDITKGVTTHAYIAGSVIANPDRTKLTVLGTLSTQADSTVSAAMGILHHPTSRVFFLGDVNGLQQVPQPLTGNLVNWLFK